MKRLITSVKRKDVLSISLLLIFGTTLFVNMVDIHAAGQDTEIQVINPRTEQSDFIFYTGTHPVGTRFNATIYGKDFTDVFTWQVTLYYNATLINCTNAWFTPEELALWGEFPLTYFYANSTKFGDTRLAPDPGVNVTGPIELAILEFEILKSPEKYKPLSCPLNIYNVNTFLIDPEGEGISVTVTDGKYEYKYAVVNLEVKPNQHIADRLETFNVEVWLNNVTESDRVIGAQFRLKYNATLLAVKNVSEGPFFREFKSCPEEPYTQFVWYNITSRDEDPQNYDLLGPHILVSVVILSYEGQYTNFPNGSGILATVTFRGRYRGFYGALNSSLTLTDIILVDDAKNPPYGEPNVIPTIEPRNGYYEISPIQVLPMLKVQPEVYEAKKKDESFQINVTVYDLDVDAQLKSVEFKLTYNATVLKVLNITEGPFLQGFGNTSFNSSVGSDSVTIRNHIETLFAGFPNGNGTIAIIAFKAAHRGFYPEETVSNLNLTEIVLLDIYQNGIPTSDSMNGFYKIFSLRLPVASFTYSPSMPLVTQEVVFNASDSYDHYPGAVVSYVWDFGDGNTTTVTSSVITHSYMAPGTYNVTLTVIDDDGLSNSDAKTVIVEAQPAGILVYAVIITVLATIVIAVAIVIYYKRIRKYKSRTV